MSLAEASWFLVAANAGGVAGRLFWGTISDRLFKGRRRGPLILVSLLGCAGFIILGWIPVSTPVILLLVIVFALGATIIGWNGVYITLLSEIAPPDKRGRSVAYGMAIAQVGIFGGPFAFGVLVDLSGSYRIAWTAVAVALLVAAVLLRQIAEVSTQGVTVEAVPAI
jgi:ACS family hexuronate transporter-like MFS transporter